MSSLSQADRDKLPASSFADPENRRYPILDGSDVEDAVSLLGKAGDEADRERVKRGIVRRARAIGATDKLPKEWAAGGGKSFDMMILPGSAVKALGDGRIGGTLALFTPEGDYDRVGDRFGPATDFNLDVVSRVPILSEHGFGPLKRRRLGVGELEMTPEGVSIKGTLNLRDDVEREIYRKAEAGEMFWSSGSAGHMVDREDEPDGSLLTSWPIIEASLTETPAEPRAVAVSIKSLLPPAAVKDADAGLGYDDSYRDGQAAVAAVRTLADSLAMCVSACFCGWCEPVAPADPDAPPPTRDERLARLRAEFDDFASDSLAVIAALMDDDDGDRMKSLAASLHRKALAHLPLTDHLDAVHDAASVLRDRLAAVADLRARQGRGLSAARRGQVKALADALAELHARSAPRSDPAARLRLLALAHSHPAHPRPSR